MYTEDKIFDKVDFTVESLPVGEYEACTFKNANFLHADLSDRVFTECIFDSCDVSMAKFTRTALRNVSFRDCKLLGLRFDHCNEFLFEVHLENCMLNHSSFYKRKMKKAVFKHCKLMEVDFTETDLTGALFDSCDLSGAIFDQTVLEKANLVTAYGYQVNPENNRIKKARFSSSGLAGLLGKYDIIIE